MRRRYNGNGAGAVVGWGLEFHFVTANFWCQVTNYMKPKISCRNWHVQQTLNVSFHPASKYSQVFWGGGMYPCVTGWLLPNDSINPGSFICNGQDAHQPRQHCPLTEDDVSLQLNPQQHGSHNLKSSNAHPDLQLLTLDCRTVTRIPTKPKLCLCKISTKWNLKLVL